MRAAVVLITGTLLCWLAPLAGLAAAGRPVAEFLVFPPRTVHVEHASFSWGAFAAVGAIALTALALCAVALARARVPGAANTPRRRFPWWGWLGVALAGTSWVLAWTEGVVPPEWRRHTFTPLWLGYALVLNALAMQRSGQSPLTHRTGWYLALFPVSAAFWWLFEHLNQFVDNWFYTGIATLSDFEYFLQATLPFATVLPAVAATIAWLGTFPRMEAIGLSALTGHCAMAPAALAAGLLLLAAIGFAPDWLFPVLWLGPLMVFLGLQQLVIGETLLAPLARGDWRPLIQPALAGLFCGFFWELWNYGSAARWHYSVPYVQGLHLSEMPLLGYTGYLPFGLECAVVMDLVSRMKRP